MINTIFKIKLSLIEPTFNINILKKSRFKIPSQQGWSCSGKSGFVQKPSLKTNSVSLQEEKSTTGHKQFESINRTAGQFQLVQLFWLSKHPWAISGGIEVFPNRDEGQKDIEIEFSSEFWFYKDGSQRSYLLWKLHRFSFSFNF